LLRDAVRGVAYRHGVAASFASKPLPHSAGSGCHLHVSVWRDGRNILYDERDALFLSREGYGWIAGLLAHLPALCALTAPSVNSYARLRPHAWAGAFACYGLDNREAAVRVVSPRRGPASFNVELKTADGSANPYLALAAVLSAGLDGLRRELLPGDPADGDPGLLTDRERAARGMVPLPGRLDEAIAALEADRVLHDVLGEPLARSYLAVRRAEWEALSTMTSEAQVRQHLFKY